MEFHVGVPALEIGAIFEARRLSRSPILPYGRVCRLDLRFRPGQDGRVKDWVAWHHGYDDPSSALSDRLERVRRYLSEAIASAPPGPVQIVSLCAGQGRDVLDVLPGHPRREDARALLVEADATNAQVASDRAAAAGLTRVYVRLADAGLVASFADVLPANVLLLCGIFGNVSESDIKRTVGAAAALCAGGATVIWTRHRRPPDLTPQLRAWFAASGFDEVAFDALENDRLTAVGVHRLRTDLDRTGGYPGYPLFTFGSDQI